MNERQVNKLIKRIRGMLNKHGERVMISNIEDEIEKAMRDDGLTTFQVALLAYASFCEGQESGISKVKEAINHL